MGPPKAVDWDFVSELGNRVQGSADDIVPAAAQGCANARNTMMEAGQGGGLLVVIGFFFASAFLEDSLERKQEVAGQLNDGAQACSRNWEATEETNTLDVGEDG